MDLYSYVVAYDSGFAPNPFHGFCTLATCKPNIRKTAKIGDWVIGLGSANKKVSQKNHLVYAMRISEKLTFNQYYEDSRFQAKKPILSGSRKQARGDNIYFKSNRSWSQLNSFHSLDSDNANPKHVKRDTSIDKVLISDHFIYFGKDGSILPNLIGKNHKNIRHTGRNHSKFTDKNEFDKLVISSFLQWFVEFEEIGFISPPFDWKDKQ